MTERNWHKIAAQYVGIPWADRDEAGLNCWGLLHRVYARELGITLPSYDSDYADAGDASSVAPAILRGLSHWRSVPLAEREPSDAVLLWVRRPSLPSHVGIYLGDGKMLHTMAGTPRPGQPASPVGAVVEPLSSPFWQRRVVGFYRHESRFDGWTLDAIANPFTQERASLVIPVGATIAEALGRAQMKRLDGGRVVVTIGEELIDEAWWSRIRPRAGVVVAAHSIPGGPLLALGLIPLIKVGLVIASFAATAWQLATSLSASPETGGTSGPIGPAESPFAAGTSNQIDPFGPVPTSYGDLRIFPPLAAPPYTETIAGERYWHLLLCVGNGRYQIDEIEVGGVPLESIEGFEVVGSDVEIIEGGTAGTYSEEVLDTVPVDDSPVDYWRLQDTAGSGTANNERGARPDLTQTGGVTFGASRLTSQTGTTSASFDGVNDRLTGSAPFTDLSGAFTIDFFAAYDAGVLAAFGSPSYMVDLGDVSDGVKITISAGGVGVVVPGAFSYESIAPLPRSRTSDRLGFHVALRYTPDVVSGPRVNRYPWALFVDGARYEIRSSIAATTASNSLTLGARKNGGSYDRYFTGRLQEVAIYESALSVDEALAHADHGTSNPSVPTPISRGPNLRLYNDTVIEVPLNIRLDEPGADDTSGEPIYGNYITRSIPGEVDELQLEVFFPSGIWRLSPTGGKNYYALNIDVEYRREGQDSDAWIKATHGAGFAALDPTQAWGLGAGEVIRVYGIEQRALMMGWSWKVPRDRYEMRLRQMTTEPPYNRSAGANTGAVASSYDLLAFRGIATGDAPVTAPGMALVGLKLPVKETGSTVGQVSMRARRMLKTVSGGVLSTGEVVTSNAAWAALDVLIGDAANPRPIDSTKVDLAAFESFSARALACNLYVDFRSNVQDLVNTILAPSFGSLGYNGKWTVVEDRAGLSPVQLIGPRNSKFLGGVERYDDLPHAIRVKYIDEDREYQEWEHIVYDDGYNADGADGLIAATKFESAELRGLTKNGASPENYVHRHFRVRLAMARLRRSEWHEEMFLDHMRCKRGDVVNYQHWAALIGQTGARVVSISTSAGNVNSFTIDDKVVYAAATNYGVVWRKSDGTIARANVTNPGASESATITFATPQLIATAPAVDDLIAFGIRDEETVEALVRDVVPKAPYSAELTLIPYAPEVFDAVDGTVPFDPVVSPPVPVPQLRLPLYPLIGGIQSDERYLIITPAGYVPRMRIALAVRQSEVSAHAAAWQVSVRRRAFSDAPAGPWIFSDWAERFPAEVFIDEVEEGVIYDVRARAQTRNGISSLWGPIITHQVIGALTPPPDVTELRVDGDKLHILYESRDVVRDFDGFLIRYLHGWKNQAPWSSGTPAHTGVWRADYFGIENFPREDGPLTLMVRAVDLAGTLSAGTKRVTLPMEYRAKNIVLEYDQSALGWPGTKTDCTVSGDDLIADLTAADDTKPMWIANGLPMWSPDQTNNMWHNANSLEMEYLTGLTPTGALIGSAIAFPVYFEPEHAIVWKRWREMGPTAMWSDDTSAMWSTDTADMWTGWSEWRFWIGPLKRPIRKPYEFKVTVRELARWQSKLTGMSIISDVEDRTDVLNDVVISAAGSRLPLTSAFYRIDRVALTIQSISGETAAHYLVIDKDINGPLVIVQDVDGNPTRGTVDAEVFGY